MARTLDQIAAMELAGLLHRILLLQAEVEKLREENAKLKAPTQSDA